MFFRTSPAFDSDFLIVNSLGKKKTVYKNSKTSNANREREGHCKNLYFEIALNFTNQQ